MDHHQEQLVTILSLLHESEICKIIQSLSVKKINLISAEVIFHIKAPTQRTLLKNYIAKVTAPPSENSKKYVDTQQYSSLYEQINSDIFNLMLQSIDTAQVFEQVLKRASNEEINYLHKQLSSNTDTQSQDWMIKSLEKLTSNIKKLSQSLLAKETKAERDNFLDTLNINELNAIKTQLNEQETTPQLKLALFSIEKATTKINLKERQKKQTYNSDSLVVANLFHKIEFTKSELQYIENKMEQPAPPPIKSGFSLFLTKVFTFFSKLFKSTATPRNAAALVETEIITTEKEQRKDEADFEKFRAKGDKKVADVTGENVNGVQKQKKQSQVEDTLNSRLGFALASQVVAGTVSKSHDEATSVIDSLCHATDTNADIIAIKKVIIGDALEENIDLNVINMQEMLLGEHAFAIGGYPEIVTSFELSLLNQLTDFSSDMSAYGISLTDAEKIELTHYRENLDNSKDLNNGLNEICASFGGYSQRSQKEKEFYDENIDNPEVRNNGNRDYKRYSDFKQRDNETLEQAQKRFEQAKQTSVEEEEEFKKNIALAGRVLQKKCNELSLKGREGESIFLETGLEGHAMQLVITKKGESLKLSCYDSSGALERTHLANGLIGLFKVWLRGDNTKTKNACAFTIPASKLQSQEGIKYLSQLVELNSYSGWAEESIKNKSKHTSMEERSRMSWIGKLLALRDQSFIYSNYLDKFSSIADKDAPLAFEELLQRPQNTQNCFAKKMQACELHQLGKSLYKKVRLATLLEQREKIIQDISSKGKKKDSDKKNFLSTEYATLVKDITPEVLSPQELNHLSLRLTESKGVPSASNYIKYYKALVTAKDKLLEKPQNANAQMAVDRINDKLNSRFKEYYDYLKAGNLVDEIRKTFQCDEAGNVDWSQQALPLLKNEDSTFSDTALLAISKYSTALAWKSTIRILNHNIVKLQVNQRYIVSQSERSQSASLSYASSKATIDNIKNANIIAFESGMGRSENMFVEITFSDNERREISPKDFFKLLLEKKESLTDPKVINLLAYIRNETPELELLFITDVYPTQVKEFINALGNKTHETRAVLDSTVNNFESHKLRLTKQKTDINRSISQLETELLNESREGRKNLKVKSLELRIELLKKETAQIDGCLQNIDARLIELKLDANIEGSVLNKLKNSDEWVNLKNLTTEKLPSIRELTNEFVTMDSMLSEINLRLSNFSEQIETENYEEIINKQSQAISNYRFETIKNHLQTNPEFQILNEASGPNIGTNKSRNSQLYNMSAPLVNTDGNVAKSNYKTGSIFEKINSLNKRLITQILERTKAESIAHVKWPEAGEAIKLSDIKSLDNIYRDIDVDAASIAKNPISDDIKEQWVDEMFTLWLEHSPQKDFESIDKQSNRQELANQSFVKFLEKYTNTTSASLVNSKFPIKLNTKQIEQLVSKLSKDERMLAKEQRNNAANKIKTAVTTFLSEKKTVEKKITLTTKVASLTGSDLKSEHVPCVNDTGFKKLSIEFISSEDLLKIEQGTLQFLKDNPLPKETTNVEVDSAQIFFEELIIYHDKLQQHKTVENKSERIAGFANYAIDKLSRISKSPPPALISLLTQNLLGPYRDEDNDITNAFLKLENTQRSRLLKNLIRLSLVENGLHTQNPIEVNPAFYSIIKQMGNLILPKDSELASLIDKITPNGLLPHSYDYIIEVDTALHQSSVTLEGIDEGQRGLQLSLYQYGKERGAADSKLRKIADRLMMRNGKAMLAKQFIQFFSDNSVTLSSEGINSVQGRELFSRAFIDAYQHANDSNKTKLLQFIDELSLYVDLNNEVSSPKTPHNIFLNELTLSVLTLSMQQKNIKGSQVKAGESLSLSENEKFINGLTNESIINGEDRLFGFAKEINFLSLRIDNTLAATPINYELLDTLYSKLICSNLAYRLLLDDVTPEIKQSFSENFDYHNEMSLAKSNMLILQDRLTQFSSDISAPQKKKTFNKVLKAYQHSNKFNGLDIKIDSVLASKLPGFISLGGARSLDVLNGTIYIGQNKRGIMPSFIQSHVDLQELGIDSLPFIPHGGGYRYESEGKIRATIVPSETGELTIQRELLTIDNEQKLLQYISPSKLNEFPAALQKRIGVSHIFIDEEGSIHGFTNDFTPVLKIKNGAAHWNGVLVDHNKQKIEFTLYEKSITSAIKENLSKFLPSDEMVLVDESTVYVPAMKQFISYDISMEKLSIFSSLNDRGGKCTIEITENGAGYIESSLSTQDKQQVEHLDKMIVDLQSQLSSITKQDIISVQKIEELKGKIGQLQEKKLALTNPEFFLFRGDSPLITKQEQELEVLREQMLTAYSRSIEDSGDKEGAIGNYDKTKQEYFLAKQKLSMLTKEESHIIRYSSTSESSLKPQSFTSLLNIGKIPGQKKLLTSLLGKQIPQAPLKANELEELRQLKTSMTINSKSSKGERLSSLMLTGIEIQHHLLERQGASRGRIKNWDSARCNDLKKVFKKELNEIIKNDPSISFENFQELWREIQSEFIRSAPELDSVMVKSKQRIANSELRPINFISQTTQMPIERMGLKHLVKFACHTRIEQAQSQSELIARLNEIKGKDESVQKQESGYFYENYGLLDKETLLGLFKVSADHKGITGFKESDVDDILKIMLDAKWIEPVGKDELAGETKYRLTKHPSEFLSSEVIKSHLKSKGYNRSDIKKVSSRLEIFLYQTATVSGTYELEAGAKETIIEGLKLEITACNLEVLQAKDKISSILTKATSVINETELNSAFLLNDYSEILPYFDEQARNQVEIALRNATARKLFFKTELEHLKDIQNSFSGSDIQKGLELLHTKRNYQLDELLNINQPGSEMSEKESENLQQSQKIQRAFLLFESEFGHRCNARQVDIFRGLLLEDRLDPDKIDSAQARMGFGKTSLLPLVALCKTGDRLVRFVVPKSALETNTFDMSSSLVNLLGKRAFIDDFHRYIIATDQEKDMGKNSPRLESLQNAKADLLHRLSLYNKVQKNKHVLVQAPHVRNALECQQKIFLDLLIKLSDEPQHKKELISCISIINEIRSLTSVTVFDELDATQDPNTTDVNFTSGEKIDFDEQEIYPIEIITETIIQNKEASCEALADLLLEKFSIADPGGKIKAYVLSMETAKPDSVSIMNQTPILLIRALLTESAVLKIITEKEASTDFGVWFSNQANGTKHYDKTSADNTGKEQPLLITVPYLAANTPKPKGSRFDNPEVTAISTFLYYLDSRTEISEVPHLEYMIENIRNGDADFAFTDNSDTMSKEAEILLKELQEISEIEDPLIRNAKRGSFYNEILNVDTPQAKSKQALFRKVLARTIIKEQIKYDAGKANSDRNEQGTTADESVGFSGTSGDTSSQFKINRLDYAADGNMTLGIMGRDNCQTTASLDTVSDSGDDYTKDLIHQLSNSFNENTRTLIDVGGLCKLSNKEVASLIIHELKKESCPIKGNQGVIFFDDVTNTKKLLNLNADGTETVSDLSKEMVNKSDSLGSYFTYFDQSHTRGADIKQMDKAHALLTMNFMVTNNDYKQAIMRMRKIVTKSSGQSFSTATPQNVEEAIRKNLKLDPTTSISGNDISVWLRQKELLANKNIAGQIQKELGSVLQNAILQQQADITQSLDRENDMSDIQTQAYIELVKELDSISSYISHNQTSLMDKYGNSYGTIKRDEFLTNLSTDFDRNFAKVFEKLNIARKALNLKELPFTAQNPYKTTKDSILKMRGAQLEDTFSVPKSSAPLSEVQSEVESQAESNSQSQSQAQTHSFSQVTAEEELNAVPVLHKMTLDISKPSIEFLNEISTIDKLHTAHSIIHLAKVFTPGDKVMVSPIYSQASALALSQEKPIPPVKYLLVRETEAPKVILVNQDEADLFFAENKQSTWSLYDIESFNHEAPLPIKGRSIQNIDPLTIKKLQLMSYQYQLTGNDMPSIANSFLGICEEEDLSPTLDMSFINPKNYDVENDDIFNIANWGFSGETIQDVEIGIRQFKTKHPNSDKEGLYITVGSGSEQQKLFIPSALFKRILEKTNEPIALPESSTNTSPLLAVIESIKKEYKDISKKRQQLKADITKHKKGKQQFIIEQDELIKQKETEINNDILAAKAKIKSAYMAGIASQLNVRADYAAYLMENLDKITQFDYFYKIKKFKEITGSKYKRELEECSSLDEAVADSCNELYRLNTQRKKPFSEEEIQKQVDEQVQDLLKQSILYLDADMKPGRTKGIFKLMYAYTKGKRANHKNNNHKKIRVSDEVQLQGMSVDDFLQKQLPAVYFNLLTDKKGSDNEIDHSRWKELVACIESTMIEGLNSKDSDGKSTLTEQQFYECFYRNINEYRTKYEQSEPPLPDDLIDNLLITMLYAYSEDYSGNPRTSIDKLNADLTKHINSKFIEALGSPSAPQKVFYNKLASYLEKQNLEFKFELPEILCPQNDEEIDESKIREAIIETLNRQELEYFATEVDFHLNNVLKNIKAQRQVNLLLENYEAKNGPRSQYVTDSAGDKFIMLGSVNKQLLELDTKLVDKQTQLATLKLKRQSGIEEYDKKLKTSRKDFVASSEQYNSLKKENSAVNKLVSNIGDFFSIFAKHHISIHTVPESSINNVPDVSTAQAKGITFIAQSFNLGKILQEKVDTGLSLIFTPPKVYKMEGAMEAQVNNRHGLNALEEKSYNAFSKVMNFIKNAAKSLRGRAHTNTSEMIQSKEIMLEQPLAKISEKQQAKNNLLAPATQGIAELRKIMKNEKLTKKSKKEQLAKIHPAVLNQFIKNIAKGELNIEDKCARLSLVPIKILIDYLKQNSSDANIIEIRGHMQKHNLDLASHMPDVVSNSMPLESVKDQTQAVSAHTQYAAKNREDFLALKNKMKAAKDNLDDKESKENFNPNIV